MTETDNTNHIDTSPDCAEFVTEPLNLQAVIRQIRICRSTLGAILDVLETEELDTDSVERAAEASMNVMAETEQLWNTVK
jgi:hypothetical protein